MNAVMPFDFEGRAIRVVEDDDGLPWFVARDVCEALGIRNSRHAVDRLDDDERSDVVISDTRSKGEATQARTVQTVNEPGLYRLTLTSRKPEAKRFVRWITHDVLPAIRKTGRYAAEEQVPPLAAQPQHRADQMVSAGRIFNAALRTARAMRMPTARAMRAATDCAQRHTGIDWKTELDAAGFLADQDSASLADETTARVADFVAGRTDLSARDIILGADLGDPNSRALQMRVAVIMKSLRWQKRRLRNPADRQSVGWVYWQL